MSSGNQVIVFCLLLILFCSVGCGVSEQAYSPTELHANLNSTWTLAVFPFEIVGESDLTGEEAMNLVSTELVGIDGYKVVDRAALEEMLEKYGFELSKLENSQDRARRAKLLNAQLICQGTVNAAKELKLVTARVVFAGSSETLIVEKAGGGKEVKNINELARRIRNGLVNQKVVAILNKISEPDVPSPPPPPLTVEVKGYGAIVDGDVITAKKLALKDAYANAIEEGFGIRASRVTLVEKYVAVRDMIFTESWGYVTSYEVVDENPDSTFGYEVTVRAGVSQEPIPDLEKLKLVVRYLHTEPRIMVLIDGSVKGEELGKSRGDVIAGRISSQLLEAGFQIVDTKTIEEKKAETGDLSSDEDTARLGGLAGADLVVRGTLTAEITGRIEDTDFPIISAMTTGVFRIIRPQTAEIISAFDHGELGSESNIGRGNTDDEAIENSLHSFILVGANKLAWELARKLGEPIQMRLELRNITREQAQKLERQLQSLPKHIVLEAKMEQHKESVAAYQLKTSVGSQILEQKLRKLIDLKELGSEQLIPEEADFGSIIISLKK
jgi:hypothetical protein